MNGRTTHSPAHHRRARKTCVTPAAGDGTGALSLRLLAVIAFALAAFLALAATPAIAAPGYKEIGEIAGTGTGRFGSLRSESITVNPKDGHILVADSSDGLVYDFASTSDTSPVIWEGTNTPAGSFGGGRVAVAVDHSTGDVYVSDTTHAVIDKFDESGALIEGFGDTENELTQAPEPDGQLKGLQTPAGGFAPSPEPEEALLGIAVDQADGDLYVLDMNNEVVDIFSSSGVYEEQIPVGEAFTPFSDGLAVDAATGDIYVSKNSQHVVIKFEPDGEVLQRIDGAETPEGSFGGVHNSIAADGASEKLFVSDPGHDVVDAYEFAGAYAGARITDYRGGERFEGLGVDEATGEIYAGDAVTGSVDIYEATVLPDVITEPATAVTIEGATLNGLVNPLDVELEECFFEYGETTAYGETAACEQSPSQIGDGGAPVAVSAAVDGLEAGKTYHFRLVAVTENGTNANSGDRSLFTGASIESTSVSQVSATAAKLEAELDPHGTAAQYHFEYGLTPSYEASVPIPDATIPATEGTVAVATLVQGLRPGTTYHYRIVTRNGNGVVDGPDAVFFTPLVSSFSLPDDRGWELVSPPDKHGYLIIPQYIEGSLIQASASGDALTYIALGPITGAPAGNRSPSPSQFISRRGESGWSTADVTPTHEAIAGTKAGELSEYDFFSPDLARSALMPAGISRLAPYVTEKTPYIRAADGEYQPLLVGCPAEPAPCPQSVAEHANVPPGTVFGPSDPESSYAGGAEIVGADPSVEHVIFSSPRELTPGFVSDGDRSLYEWTESGIAPVSILPDGRSAGQEGASASLGNSPGIVRNAVSADGSRIVFTVETNGRPGLYLRDLARGQTVRLDAAEAGCGGCESGRGIYQDASADGSRVFFKSAARLTADSSAGEGHADLYMCQIVEAPGGPTCELRDLTVTVDPHESADVMGAIVGASRSGSSVYFIANGRLQSDDSPVAGAIAGDCVVPNIGGGESSSRLCNLYDENTTTGETRLVADISNLDYPDWSGGSASTLNQLTARVSPSGEYLAFMSERSLTRYDNRDARSGERDEEVFVYHSAADMNESTLVCASCDPSAARPQGIFVPSTGLPAESEKSVPLIDGSETWKRRWVAATIPTWQPTGLNMVAEQPRYLSDSGRLFFNSTDALSPQDSNGVADVYQYEPLGTGSCGSSEPSFSSAAAGCVSLISSGTSTKESVFLDASESGDAAFFLTVARLSSRDSDSAPDIYVAKVGGGEAAPVKPVECSGDACQQPAVPPDDATPSSLTFNGAGNVLECPKGKVQKSGKCVKQKSKKHKKKSKSTKKSKKNNKGRKHAKKRANSGRGGHQ
jgi:hypothetical protein